MMKLGIQGGVGSFNEEAVNLLPHILHQQFDIIYLHTSQNVVNSVVNHQVDLGLMAFYNTLGGEVEETNLAWNQNLSPILTLGLPIRHFMFALPNLKPQDLTQVMSHPQVFKQCRHHLNQRWPHLRHLVGQGEYRGTAGAARALTQAQVVSTTAVIGSYQLGTSYQLNLIDSDLQDDPTNTTWFILFKSL